jgi:hypothetical protein
VKFKFLMTAILATAFFGTPSWAFSHPFLDHQKSVAAITTKTEKATKYSETMTFTETNSFSGPCTGGAGFANICPSGSCDCIVYTGTAKGTAGTGAVTINETYDDGLQSTAFETGCSVAYGDIEINGSKDVESILFDGGDCFSEFTPQGILNGACQLGDTQLFTTGGMIGSCGGTYSMTGGKFSIKGEALK